MTENQPILIRLYEKKDQETIRAIACDTADAGKPVENFFSDRDFIADLVTNYYLDHEPHHTWVADIDGKAQGYLTGCINSKSYEKEMGLKIFPLALFKAIFRGALFKRETYSFFWGGIKTGIESGNYRAKYFKDYPAHLHINLLPSIRGERIGERLVQKFFDKLKQMNIPGCHLAARADNLKGRQFFESMGFQYVEKKSSYLPGKNGLENHELAVYVRKI